MPLIQYKFVNLRKESRKIVDMANDILEEYQAQGYSLTLRQLYYQFVARDLFPETWRDKKTGSTNNMKSYKNLGNIVNDARLTGLMDWLAIVDRTRGLTAWDSWDSPYDIMQGTVEGYHEDLWAKQDWRIEVWVEKDALAGTIEPICRKLDVPYLSCRGYTSQSEMWQAAMRLKRFTENDQQVLIIHLGDHDPSGLDMTRDIRDRMEMFGADVEVDRVALNMDQIRKLKPPPNPAKVTDPRAKGYIRKFGRVSWELDALEPKYIHALIEKAVGRKRIDSRWKKSVKVQEKNRKRLSKLADELE